MHDLDPLSTVAAERLRALPNDTVEPYGWEEFRRRASAATRGVPRGAMSASVPLGAAAAMLLVCGATAVAVWMWGQATTPESRAARAVQVGSATATGPAATEAAPGSDRLDARAMELWLARQPADPAMVRVGSYAAVAGLEDRIAQLDDLLTAARAEGVRPGTLSPLEKQRAGLMSSLAQVRYAQTLVADSPP